MKKNSQFTKETIIIVYLVTFLYYLIINYFIDNLRELKNKVRTTILTYYIILSENINV